MRLFLFGTLFLLANVSLAHSGTEPPCSSQEQCRCKEHVCPPPSPGNATWSRDNILPFKFWELHFQFVVGEAPAESFWVGKWVVYANYVKSVISTDGDPRYHYNYYPKGDRGHWGIMGKVQYDAGFQISSDRKGCSTYDPHALRVRKIYDHTRGKYGSLCVIDLNQKGLYFERAAVAGTRLTNELYQCRKVREGWYPPNIFLSTPLGKDMMICRMNQTEGPDLKVKRGRASESYTLFLRD